VTGSAGYIGSVLTRRLLEKGHNVRGLDSLLFGGESLLGVFGHPSFEFRRGDIRDRRDLLAAVENIDQVVHLAAIVGDPACAKQPELATETNWSASQILFNLCLEQKHIERFVFASTCSNYGRMKDEQVVDERSSLRPVSLYAELKVRFEKLILEGGVRRDFAPVSLRFATVYGVSPRMRFDLTVNEFVRDVWAGKELQVYGEQFWRPYCHVRDLAEACLLALECKFEKIRQNVYNVGDSRENYQKKFLAEDIRRLVPTALIRYVHKQEDPRDYKVNFNKIRKELNFRITRTVSEGIREVLRALQSGIFMDPYQAKYQNI
jgi:nucleoside-diphosphate-sugar epimerase